MEIHHLRESFAKRRMRHRRPIPIVAALLVFTAVLAPGQEDEDETYSDLLARARLVIQKYRQSYGVDPTPDYVEEYLSRSYADTMGLIPGRTSTITKSYWPDLQARLREPLPPRPEPTVAEEADRSVQRDSSLSLQSLGQEFHGKATAACRRHIENLAAIDFRWTDRMLEAKFPEWIWGDEETRVVRYIGDAIQFQNPNGAWMRHRYWCDYGTRPDRPLEVGAEPGRLPR